MTKDLSTEEVIALVEAFLRDNGWTQCDDQRCAYWHDSRTGRQFNREDARWLQMQRHIASSTERLRANRYEAAIRQHRDQKGHDRCWEDDAKLYAVLPEGPQVPNGLPPKDEFLAGCARYERLRRNPMAPIDSTASDPMTLLANERCRAEQAEVRAAVMRAAIEFFFRPGPGCSVPEPYDPDYGEPSKITWNKKLKLLEAALRSDVGKGWVSPDALRELSFVVSPLSYIWAADLVTVFEFLIAGDIQKAKDLFEEAIKQILLRVNKKTTPEIQE